MFVRERLSGEMPVVDPYAVIAEVRRSAPLVHCITSTVTMALVADGLLAFGARPMMTETLGEAPTLTTLADALLVNLGTLSTDGEAGIPATVEVTARDGAPWVLDPAAIGVAPVRTPLARDLLRHRPSVGRANASEVLALAGLGEGGAGPDSLDRVPDALAAAYRLAEEHAGAVAISGATDVVVSVSDDGHRTETQIHNGHPLLTQVTGTGCLLGALTAACAAVADPHSAAVAATLWLDLAAERAAAECRGPGSFKIALLDELAGSAS